MGTRRPTGGCDSVTMRHPLRVTAALSLLAYVGVAAAVFWRRPLHA